MNEIIVMERKARVTRIKHSQIHLNHIFTSTTEAKNEKIK